GACHRWWLADLQPLDLVRANAGGEVPVLDLDERGNGLTRVDRVAAAWAKPAALRRIEEVGRRPFNGRKLAGATLVEPRHRGQQTTRVGMQGPAEHALRRSALDEAGRVH